ncbi:hypothetical protein C0989_011560 [Termitomyces sp. Mn162]|nr:hypothetical protein C0989_011560 [Termitomyces sp. Mn162]
MSGTLQYVPRALSTADSVVHLEYHPHQLAAVPGSDWTRFVCISDTHVQTFDIPDGDVLLHSGDLTNLGLLKEFEKVMEWIYQLPHKTKILIAGNHDLTLHEDWYQEEYHRWHRTAGKQERAKIVELLTGPRAREAGVVYLQDSSYTFRTKPEGRSWSVYGSPWSPWFHNWAFNYNREDGEALLSNFPATDILLTHGPPARILDRTQSLDFAGCADLRNHLPRLRPRLHVFGHIHESRGAHVHAWGPEGTNTLPEVTVIDDDDDDDEDEDNMDDLDIGFKPDEDCHGNEDVAVDRKDTGKDGDGTQRLHETVFVNASNSPAGKGTWRAGQRVPAGGPGFQPVVVDLRD